MSRGWWLAVVIVLAMALVGFRAWRVLDDCDPANLVFPCHTQLRIVVHQPR